MNLLQFQRRMAQDVTRPLTLDFGMQLETEEGRALSEHAAAYIKPNDRLTSGERLEIYNRQYWFRVIAAVADDYPALQAVLGEKQFDHMVRAYLRENPSTSFTLRNLGARLPQWLGQHPEFAPRRHSLAIDVARLEWAYIEAFDGAPHRPLGALAISGLTGDSKLKLQPHLQLLYLRYPVDDLVLAVRKSAPPGIRGGDAATGQLSTVTPRLRGTRRAPVFLAVHRFADSVYYRRLAREGFLLLAALKKGYSLAAAIEEAFAGSDDTAEEQAAKIGEYFAHASELGWFCGNEPNSGDRSPQATYSYGRRASLR